MELLEIIKNKRSCKKFLSTPVEQEKLDKIIEAGVYASSGMNQQSPIIIQITNKEIIDKLEAVNASVAGWRHGSHPFYNAPVVLLVASKKIIHTTTYDGSLVCGNMLLEAYDLGLGACWIHRAKESLEDKVGKEIFEDLGLDANEYEGIANIVVGYPDPEYKPPFKEIKQERVFRIK